MNVRSAKQLIVCCTLGAATLFSVCLTSQADKKHPSGSGSVFAPDKGKFNIELDGRSVGHEEFEIAPSANGWATHSVTDIKPPDSASSRVTGTLTLQADGVPVSYDWTSQADKTNGAHIVFADGVAKITLQMQGARPYEEHMSFGTPLVSVLDNNIYYQYAVLARVYDWSKGGEQNFPVLIPQELTPGSIKVESTGPATVNGKSYEGLRVVTSDLEVQLFLDSSHRLMRLEVPSAKVAVVRE